VEELTQLLDKKVEIPMRQVLDKQAVKDWLSGQQAAATRIKDERVRFLLTLTPERSLQIYLDLWDSGERAQAILPSSLLVMTRQAFARKAVKGAPVGS